MSLITQCPACHTLFKVVADQLKISGGWVRCGQCREVFDAQAHWASSKTGDATPSQPPVEIEPQQKTAASNTELDRNIAQTAPPEKGEAPLVSASSPLLSAHPDFASSDWINSVNPPAPTNPDVFGDSDGALDIDPLAKSFTAGDGPATSLENSDASQPPNFVLLAQRAGRWRTPWARAGLSFGALLLLCAMVWQVVHFERDRIVAAEPAAAPWMVSMCRVVECTVGPLKHIESIVVDASSFNKIRSDGRNEFYKITLNLKNTGTLPVAVPHVELSLNDTQDQALLRRVLSPADLGALQLSLVPRAELATGATIQIDATQLAGARIAGYRVLAFYP